MNDRWNTSKHERWLNEQNGLRPARGLSVALIIVIVILACGVGAYLGLFVGWRLGG